MLIIIYLYCYVYVLVLLCIFRSVYSVSLFRSLYCLCVNVYCTELLPPCVNPIAVNKYIVSYHINFFFSLPTLTPCSMVPIQKPMDPQKLNKIPTFWAKPNPTTVGTKTATRPSPGSEFTVPGSAHLIFKDPFQDYLPSVPRSSK